VSAGGIAAGGGYTHQQRTQQTFAEYISHYSTLSSNDGDGRFCGVRDAGGSGGGTY
jgi:hypothetical protein